jgi:hypothetical protein
MRGSNSDGSCCCGFQSLGSTISVGLIFKALAILITANRSTPLGQSLVWSNNKVKQFHDLKPLIFHSLYRIPKNKVKQFLNLPHLEGRYNPQFLNNKVKQFSEAPS